MMMMVCGEKTIILCVHHGIIIKSQPPRDEDSDAEETEDDESKISLVIGRDKD